MVFLQLRAFFPCFLWNQQSLGDVEDLEEGAGVEDLLNNRALGVQAQEVTAFTWSNSSRTQREGSRRRRRHDSDKAHLLLEPKLEVPILSQGEGEIEHQTGGVGETILGG